MKDLFLMIQLGLGDALICNGLVRSLAPQYEKVYVPAWTHNLPSVQFMFGDEPKIIVQPVGTPNEIFIMQVFHESNGVKILKLGCYSGEPHKEPETFDQTFYRQAGVDFSRRWDGFHVPKKDWIVKGSASMPNTLHASEPFIMICDSAERGFNIDDSSHESRVDTDLIKVRPWKAETIFEFSDYLNIATEIHCINSAFAILADSVPTTGKLFMHRYARPHTPYDNFKVRKNWTILS